MSVKQDLQGVRTASQLEQKYRIGESFAKAFNLAEEAKRAAEDAKKTATEGMTPDEIFNALTNNGQNKGLYRGEDGELYINASYIVSGILNSVNGATKFNLNEGSLTTTSSNGYVVDLSDGSLRLLNNEGTLILTLANLGFGCGIAFRDMDGKYCGSLTGTTDGLLMDGAVINKGKKKIFTGNQSAGSTFDVPLTKNYDLFAVKLGAADSTEDTVVLAYKNGNTINGVGGWAGTVSLAKELFFVSATFSGTTWTLVDARKQGIYNAGSITTGTALNVKEIVGVI